MNYPSAAYILGGIAALIVLVNQAFIFWKNVIKEEPNPARTYRTRPDCIAIHSKDRAWMKDIEKTSIKNLKSETHDLHERIDNLHLSMTAQFKSTSGDLGEIKGYLKGKEKS